MSKRKRLFSFLLAAAVGFVITLSSLYVVFHSEHKCGGEHCQVCESVQHCLKLFSDFMPKPQQYIFVAALVFAAVLLIGNIKRGAVIYSLVRLKVKLTN